MNTNTVIEQQARYLIEERTAATRRQRPTSRKPRHHRALRRLSWL